MIQNTILENTPSFTQNTSYLKGKSLFRRSNNLTSPLILTPLIDVFSILVVYLLLNFSVTQEMPYMSKEINLPLAKNGIELENHVIVKFKNGKYFIEEDEVLVHKLVEKLLERQSQSNFNKKSVSLSTTLVVQADRKEKYKYLNEIVLAANQTGYSDIKFVVLSGSPQWLKQQ